MNRQRKALKEGTLKPDQVACLNRIGFQVDPLTKRWDGYFSNLEAYHESTGHCSVPRQHKADLAPGRWVSCQRKELKEGTLESDSDILLPRCETTQSNVSNYLWGT